MNIVIRRRLTAALLAISAVTTTAVQTPAYALRSPVAAPMAKCIPGSGNPLNPCPGS
jgi:hypothetical protein